MVVRVSNAPADLDHQQVPLCGAAW